MFSIILFIIILISLVYNSSIVISGASRGLMLWYGNVLPILLPFMLISNIIVQKVSSLKDSGRSKSFYAFVSTFLLGLLCGYPLGAKTTAEYVKANTFSKKTGNILLPICNNCSPMFISGYVIHTILKDSISFINVLFLIYLPYVFYSIIIISITFFLNRKDKKPHTLSTIDDKPVTTPQKETDLIMTGIIQITYVGVYIMLCSIIIEFVNSITYIPEYFVPIISGITEITGGLSLISQFNYEITLKKALILGVTSFGGVSAILQTYKVIKKSGLSLVYYVLFKALCGITTFYMVILFI